ncbi:MAG TPA: tetratricopeptide repeat protein [Pyrinomonadaceae bacterium]|nr:tetratricopeptide repeat protein [Pyrinomonadaceae bacterium]
MQKSSLTIAAFLLSVLFVGSTGAYAQAPAQPSPQMAAANELFRAQKFADAAKAYEAIVKDEPNNGRAWYQLAMSRFSLEQFAQAIDAFQKNVAIANNSSAMYNMACAYARLGQKEKALEWLKKSIESKVPPFVNPADDTDLAGLRDDPRFKEIVVALDKQRHPCMYSAEARQFDFWVGEWEVFNPQGQKNGTSVIQQIASGCGILENWRDIFGNEGKSINFFDTNTAKWYQYWIGSSGGPSRFSGVYSDGALRYEGEPTTVSGVKTLRRLTFFNLDANTVRQLAETSNDDGKNWSTGYDFKYVRKK